jgi:hypothetical protein
VVFKRKAEIMGLRQMLGTETDKYQQDGIIRNEELHNSSPLFPEKLD